MPNKRPRELTDIGTPDDADTIPIDDDSLTTATEVKAVNYGNLLDGYNSRTATQTNKTIDADNNTVSNIGTAEVKADIIDGQTAETSPEKANDTLMVYDNSATALRKFAMENLSIDPDIADVKKDYGATGDGVTDDQTAIQNALDNNSVVRFPAGTYLLNSKVLITASNKHIILDSGATIKAGNAGLDALIDINNLSSISNFVIEGHGVFDCDNTTTRAVRVIGLVSNFVLRDFEAKNCTNSAGVILVSSNGGNQPSDFLITDLYVQNVQEGIRTSFANSGIISNCRMRDINGQDTFEILGSNRITLVGNVVIDADTGSAFDILGSTEIDVIGNTYYMSTATSSSFAEVHDHAGSGSISRRVVISGNTMRGGQTRPAIDCDDGASEIIISNNICSDWDADFIQVDNSDNVMIHHNILKDHVSGNAVTINVGSDNTIIEFNNFDGEAISDSGTGTIIRFNDNNQTLPHEYGGLEADVSAFDGFVRISGGSTTEIKSNFSASAAPTVNDDSGSGYTVGSRWIDTTADKEYICLDATATAAVWTETTAGAGGGESNTASNVGTGDGWFKQKTGVDLEFKTVIGESNKLIVTNNTNDLTLTLGTDVALATGETYTGSHDFSSATLKTRRAVQLVVFDFNASLSTGDGKFYFHIDPSLGGNDLIDVHAEVITAGTTGNTDIQIHNVTQAADMLSTVMRIETGETATDTSAQPGTIDTANDDVAENDLIRIDVDAVQATPPKGLIVTLGFREP